MAMRRKGSKTSKKTDLRSGAKLLKNGPVYPLRGFCPGGNVPDIVLGIWCKRREIRIISKSWKITTETGK
jgi:hypothetical protein